MHLPLKVLTLSFIIFCASLIDYSWQLLNKKVILMSLERPQILYEDPKFVRIINFTSRRLGRRDPVHYIQCCARYFLPMNNSVNVHLYVKEFLSNEYRPTFVTVRFKMCDFINFFVANVQYSKDESELFTEYQGNFQDEKCNNPPGIYCLSNLTVPLVRIPASFPFEKGRVFLDYSYGNPQNIVASSCIDMELKTLPTFIRKT